MFTEQQQKEIDTTREYGLDTSLMENPEFSPKQMAEIRVALEYGLDASKIARIDFDNLQMREVRKGMQKRLDVSLYCDPDFNSEQMAEIRLGIADELEAHLYAKKDNDADTMKKVRNTLLFRKTLESQYVSGYIQDLDYVSFIKQGEYGMAWEAARVHSDKENAEKDFVTHMIPLVRENYEIIKMIAGPPKALAAIAVAASGGKLINSILKTRAGSQ